MPYAKATRPPQGSAAARGYDAVWRRLRNAKLDADPLCELCRPKIVRATVLDHIVSFREKLELRLEWSNLRSLCKPCHDSRTNTEQRGHAKQGQARPEWLPRPSCKVILVCGPPGSGKNSYLQERRAPRDIVIDLDEIQARLSGAPIYEARIEWFGPALAERNSRLAALTMESPSRLAWVIIGSPSAGQRQWWQTQLGAESVVLLNTTADECKRRIRADARRTKVMTRHLAAIEEWWAIEHGFRMVRSLKRGCDVSGMPNDPAHPWHK